MLWCCNSFLSALKIINNSNLVKYKYKIIVNYLQKPPEKS